MTKKFGFDIGGVITNGTRKDKNNIFKGDYLKNPAFPGSFEGIRKAVELCSQEKSYIVSTASIRTEAKTRHWFSHHDFYNKTGFLESNIHYVRTRRAKAPLCSELGITHFVDDHIEVLNYLKDTGINNLYLFNPCSSDLEVWKNNDREIILVQDWPSLIDKLK